MNMVGWSGKVRRIWQLRRGRRYHAYLYAETKAKNVMKDIHYKVVHHLCANYCSIFMPWTNSSRLMQGTLHKSTKRALSHLRWEKFRSETASLYDGVSIWTSKLQSSVECVER
jgi:ribosomal protein L32